MTDFVTVEQQDHVLIIRLNREEKKNALTGAMYDGMSDALDRASYDPDLRAVMITGSQACFTAGNDLEDFLNASNDSEDMPVIRFLKTLTGLEIPVTAAVNGPAIGIGTTLLLHCDLVYAAPEAKFQMPFVKLGLCPEAGSSLLIPQLVGYRRAAELLMLGDGFGAEEARNMGIVNQVIASDNYQEYALHKTHQLAEQAPSSIRATKTLLRQANKTILQAVMDAEMAHFNQLLQGAEAKEAFSAFLEKRKPDFSKL